jgi:hypothetical protein
LWLALELQDGGPHRNHTFSFSFSKSGLAIKKVFKPYGLASLKAHVRTQNCWWFSSCGIPHKLRGNYLFPSSSPVQHSIFCSDIFNTFTSSLTRRKAKIPSYHQFFFYYCLYFSVYRRNDVSPKFYVQFALIILYLSYISFVHKFCCNRCRTVVFLV